MPWTRAIGRLKLFWRFQVTLRRLRTVDLRGVRLEVSGFPRHIRNYFWLGDYERAETDLAVRHLMAADRVLEIGAAIGFVSLFCRRVIGVTHCLVVEPNPATANLLRRNYRLNGLEPDLVEAALAARDGEIELDAGDVFWANSVLTVGAPKSAPIRVPALSLPSLLARAKFQPNTLILDVEGAESLVRFADLPPGITKILIELHPQITGQAAADQVLADLRAVGFREVETRNSVYFLTRA